ncbi:MAG TPA: hypothetical protein VMV72_06025 [Verrucomicrobiae bacterium]|nr:hypothetical protein [Verrucomicrobiae bacterium]
MAVALATALDAQAVTSFTTTNGLVGPDSLITFETGSTGLPSVPGVTFSPYGTGADSTFSTVLFGNQVYGNISGAGGYSDLFLKFDPPVTEVAAYGASQGFGVSQLQVSVYGVNTQLLESLPMPLARTSFGPAFLGFFNIEGISEITWAGGNQGFFAIDNVYYGGPPVIDVPEPDFCPLLMLLLTIVVWRMKLLRSGQRAK